MSPRKGSLFFLNEVFRPNFKYSPSSYFKKNLNVGWIRRRLDQSNQGILLTYINQTNRITQKYTKRLMNKTYVRNR